MRTYNGLNQLIKVHKDGGNMSYSYKPSGMRYSKTLDGSKTTHVWDGASIVLDISDNNRVKGIYLRGSSLCAKVQDNSTHFYLHNAHGDVVYFTDENANLLKYYDYSAFGIENKAEKNDSNPFRYCGEYYDKEIKNIYLRARYYDPAVGRFTSKDPIGDGQNWYAYCNNNSVMFVDPRGLKYTVYDVHTKEVFQYADRVEASKHMYSEPAKVKLAIEAAGGTVPNNASLNDIDNLYWVNISPAMDATSDYMFGHGQRYRDFDAEYPTDAYAEAYWVGYEWGGIASASFSAAMSAGDIAKNVTQTAVIAKEPVYRDSVSNNHIITDDDAGHMFGDRDGHFVMDTVENRQRLLDVASDPVNYLGPDRFGTQFYGKTLPDGQQLWAGTRGNNLRYGGINKLPKSYDPIYGLSSPTKPSQR